MTKAPMQFSGCRPSCSMDDGLLDNGCMLDDIASSSDNSSAYDIASDSDDVMDDICQLWYENRSPLMGLFRTFTRNECDAEDLCSVTFLKMAENHSSYRSIEKPKAWMYAIACNIGKSYLRRQYMRRKVFIDGNRNDFGNNTCYLNGSSCYSLIEDVVDVSPGPCEAVIHMEFEAVVREKVGGLREDVRNTFALFCLDGKSQSEVAETLQVSVGTVKSRVHRARKKIFRDENVRKYFFG